ncbi:TIGR02301 family protein [Shinella sp. NM-101]|uniref:TIGR02301 family protein n=1 Tax=Shinella sp. NM-101 TaxID=2744455 RepID=UPI00092596F8|nr:TIGR02301 family protein [Shinella sp. NM-101]MBN9055685.1 TIGR02301 family protein [Hyphomicrobiales bacterium]OJU99942.1 MAG: TIGR02301 family protein [Shinella sp. 65-6]
MKLIRLALIASLALAGPALAQKAKPAAGTETPAAAPVEEKPAPYDERLERLSEILGAVHYLRNLCAGKAEDNWRAAMQRIIELEAAKEPKRQEKLTAAFNRGYRSFAAIYTACTDSAVVAEERYRNEGATLATEITARFGN